MRPRSAIVAGMAAGWLLATFTAVAADRASTNAEILVAQKSSMMSIQQAYDSGKLTKKRTYPDRLIAQARKSGDEIDDCMNNPDNADMPYIERLGACFCLATDNQTEGCQSSD